MADPLHDQGLPGASKIGQAKEDRGEGGLCTWMLNAG